MPPHKPMTTFAVMTLALQALGVVFGDIGTSPLYVLTAMLGTDPAFYTEAHIVGAIALVFWTLVIVVTAFYCGIVLRISKHGDGGITVLYSMTSPADRWRARIGIAGVIADGQITPAISVLSAWWGLLGIAGYISVTMFLQDFATSNNLLTPAPNPALAEVQRAEVGKWLAIGLTIVSLFYLASIQKKGTSKIGMFFGPVMLVWFGVLAWGGLPQILTHPSILWAPLRLDCIWSLITRDLPLWGSFAVLGAVTFAALSAFGAALLAATGGEALYADMGHFGGRLPIVVAWTLVMAGLLTNYFGQGAYLVTHGYDSTPFFALYKQSEYTAGFVVALAVAAACIASQALFTGCFSLVVQAISLKLVPRMKVIYTSAMHAGHVYVPTVNLFLLIGSLGFVLIFRDPDAMTYAYGMAVGTTMSITYVLIRRLKLSEGGGWQRLLLIDICGWLILLLTLGAYSKLHESMLGLIPLMFMMIFTFFMTVWERGQVKIREAEESGAVDPIQSLIQGIDSKQTAPVARVFFSSHNLKPENSVPLAFDHHFKEEGTVPRTVILVHIDSISMACVPWNGSVATVTVYREGTCYKQFELPLQDLPSPLATKSKRMEEWARSCLEIAPDEIKHTISVEQFCANMVDTHHDEHISHRVSDNTAPQVVLVTIRQGWQDPPFFSQVLECLGFVPYNAQLAPGPDEVVAKVVAQVPVFFTDSDTVWHTRWAMGIFSWMQRQLESRPQHLGIPPMATTHVTLSVDLTGRQGGERLSCIVWRHLVNQWQSSAIRRLCLYVRQPKNKFLTSSQSS